MMPEWLWQLLGLLGGCGAVYGGIRFDLGRLSERATAAAATAAEAHRRIDMLLNKGG